MRHRNGRVLLAGDSLTDAETARRCGIDFIAVLTGTTGAEAFVDYRPRAVLSDITRIEQYL